MPACWARCSLTPRTGLWASPTSSTPSCTGRWRIACRKLDEARQTGRGLKALEADRRLKAEHERVLAERDRLAEEMDRLAEPIAQIARTVSRIAICDREIGRLNATSTSKFGHIRPVLSGAAPAITALFQEGVVWDAFIAVAGLQSLPVAKGKAKVA